jgi:outer membrane protein assembly factor BamB
MKKSVKITLVVGAVLLVGLGILGYQFYKMVLGSESLTGRHESLPGVAKNIPPVTKGESDWLNWRGAEFDGKSPMTGMKTDWGTGLKKLWEVAFLCQGNSTASWSQPVIKGNRLIIPGRDSDNDLVFCLNSETGELIWKGSYPANAETAHGPGSRATPFIDSTFVYTFGRSGDLACWNLENGKLIWMQNVKAQGGAEPQWGLSATPLVLGNKVIVQAGGTATIVAYEKTTGKFLWKSLQGESGYAAIIPVKIDSSIKILAYHGKGLSCLNPEDGKELWQAAWPTEYCVNASTPIISGDVVFHASGYGMGAEALKISENSNKVLWKNKNFEAQHTDAILIDGYIYGYSGESSRNKGDFKCLDLKTGKEMWSSKEIGLGTCAYADGHLICLDYKGNLYLIKPSPKSFQKVGEMKNAIPEVKALSWTGPVIANGKLYLRYMQRLICYDLRK